MLQAIVGLTSTSVPGASTLWLCISIKKITLEDQVLLDPLWLLFEFRSIAGIQEFSGSHFCSLNLCTFGAKSQWKRSLPTARGNGCSLTQTQPFCG